MTTLAKSLVFAALITALLLGLVILSMTSGDASAEDKAGALLISLVIGIPVAGFCIVLLLGAGLSSAAGKRNAALDTDLPETQPRPAATQNAPPAPDRPAPPPSSGLNFLGFLSLAGAVLWTIPNGFLSFVTLVTGDEKALSYFLFWFLPAAAMFALGKALRSAARSRPHR